MELAYILATPSSTQGTITINASDAAWCLVQYKQGYVVLLK